MFRCKQKRRFQAYQGHHPHTAAPEGSEWLRSYWRGSSGSGGSSKSRYTDSESFTHYASSSSGGPSPPSSQLHTQHTLYQQYLQQQAAAGTLRYADHTSPALSRQAVAYPAVNAGDEYFYVASPAKTSHQMTLSPAKTVTSQGDGTRQGPVTVL